VPAPATSTKNEIGVNVAGYLAAESGVGAAARGYIHALQEAGSKVALNNFEMGATSRKLDSSFGEFASNNPFAINLVCVNADQLPAFISKFGERYFEGKYNIGVWWWELADFPQEYWESFRWFDELWVGSSFIQQSLARYSPIPIVCIPPSVELPLTEMIGRERLGLAGDEYIFLFMFDLLSGFERKNPLALVQAFRKAFTPDQPVRLVLKCINGEKTGENLATLGQAVGDARVTFIHDYYSSEETISLVAACDCYVSLHRSEGLGLPLVEAMLLHKPVIATGWSGNIDFMGTSNSYLVPYRLAANDRDAGPYRAGEFWAEPDIDFAAKAMVDVFARKDESQLRAAQGAIDAAGRFSRERIGSLISDRLAAIKCFHPTLADEVPQACAGEPAPFLLDETVQKQLKIIAGGGTTDGATETGKTIARRLIMPIVERAGYLNSIYSQLFNKLFAQYATFKTRIDLIDNRVRNYLSSNDARMRALEDEVKQLRQDNEKLRQEKGSKI
jgi:glycosyltransferase involved in cell wall biosynthesis